ncbi:hypothetical protein BO71DRAFT_430623 [Aspergillus ellipticus CBS 707.79]|uniref:Uncharacterized protein n=1 Tax=Aspergillus ellipticus CBS 707.79 TaxID=1448320 RepID=A0A319E001_9EURO|nr:hypothetical protein BO71DRAFT_430623 [Aspergillus ellipticus CBS 707.79]
MPAKPAGSMYPRRIRGPLVVPRLLAQARPVARASQGCGSSPAAKSIYDRRIGNCLLRTLLGGILRARLMFDDGISELESWSFFDRACFGPAKPYVPQIRAYERGRTGRTSQPPDFHTRTGWISGVAVSVRACGRCIDSMD